jgi:diguanylate cyclase
VTTEWLENAAKCSDQDGGEDVLNRLMAKLESSIEEFSQTTSTAHTATTKYSSALEAQVDELNRVTHAGVV